MHDVLAQQQQDIGNLSSESCNVSKWALPDHISLSTFRTENSSSSEEELTRFFVVAKKLRFASFMRSEVRYM
jgi:hypothetical protein